MVFISHKSDPDHARALQIAEELRKNKINCWLAPEDVERGKDFVDELTEALNACEYFLLILSKETMKAQYVRKEIGLALELKKRFIILRHGDFKLTRSFWYLLDGHQFMPFDWDAADHSELIELCRRGERCVNMEISIETPRNITIIRGDFQDNMDHFISSCPQELSRTVFAIGMDRSADLKISSTMGILRGVCQYLKETYHVSVEELQDLVNAAKIEQLGHKDGKQEMNFKDAVVIRVPVSLPGDGGAETYHLQLMLIANTQKNKTYYETKDIDEVEGVDSREIIMEVFQQCSKMGDAAKNLFIGAMGTNGLSFPYEVVTAEIVNCFAYSYHMGLMPQNLIYSVRESDMKKNGLSVDDILTYISHIVYYFRR